LLGKQMDKVVISVVAVVIMVIIVIISVINVSVMYTKC
jgi:hypothetical protein